MASRQYDIAVLPGDGIGEEVVREGVKVMQTLSEIHGFRMKLTSYPYGADHYLKTGETMPESAFSEMAEQHAILLGAIGDPRIETGYLERAIIAGIRFRFDLYINLRPIKLYAEHLCPLKGKKPEDVDMVFVRENTEDAYTGLGGIFKQSTPDEVAMAVMLYTRKGCERAVRYAFEVARKRDKRRHVTLVDKANAVRAQDIWTRTFAEVAAEYPEITTDHAYIDAACMWMVKNPDAFDVAVTSNIFGDIITDLGAMVQGGMGVAASGNIHPGRVSMFEPIHGSAPKYRGKNVANPLATIMAGGMLLDFIGEQEAAQRLEETVQKLLCDRTIRSLKTGEHKTDEIGDLVVSALTASA